MVVLTAACVFTSRPQLPVDGDAGADGGTAAYDAASDVFLPPSDAPTAPDVPAPPDVATADAAAVDTGPFADAVQPSSDASTADTGESNDCRFVVADAVDGGVPDGAVVRDGGYFANTRGEPCDPTATPADGGLRDGGEGDAAEVGLDAARDAVDAGVDDVGDAAAPDGAAVDVAPGDGTLAGG